MTWRALTCVLLATVAAAGCTTGSSPTKSVTEAGPGPAARKPVLTACPTPGSASSLARVTLSCLGGGPRINTAALGGTPVLLNLWASWCVPCQREMPALQAAYVRYGTQVGFLGVDTEDDLNNANDFLATMSIHYPQVVDDDGKLLHKVGGAGLPVTLVLDANGRTVFSHRGQLRGNDLKAALTAAACATRKRDGLQTLGGSDASNDVGARIGSEM